MGTHGWWACRVLQSPLESVGRLPPQHLPPWALLFGPLAHLLTAKQLFPGPWKPGRASSGPYAHTLATSWWEEWLGSLLRHYTQIPFSEGAGFQRGRGGEGEVLGGAQPAWAEGVGSGTQHLHITGSEPTVTPGPVWGAWGGGEGCHPSRLP